MGPFDFAVQQGRAGVLRSMSQHSPGHFVVIDTFGAADAAFEICSGQ